jgi:hypothetical protein
MAIKTLPNILPKLAKNEGPRAETSPHWDCTGRAEGRKDERFWSLRPFARSSCAISPSYQTHSRDSRAIFPQRNDDSRDWFRSRHRSVLFVRRGGRLSNLTIHASNLGFRVSNLTIHASNLGLRVSNLTVHASNFGVPASREFKGAGFKDQRLNRRLVSLSAAVARNPALSLVLAPVPARAPSPPITSSSVIQRSCTCSRRVRAVQAQVLGAGSGAGSGASTAEIEACSNSTINDEAMARASKQG